MLEQLKEILNTTNSSYEIIYEEKHIMNVKVDELNKEQSFVYIEEFIRGRFTQEKYRKTRTMQMQIYFSKFVEMHENALVRQALRDQIENEIVLKFMSVYEASNYFANVENWNIYYPLPRWDANEVSVMLEFDCKLNNC